MSDDDDLYSQAESLRLKLQFILRIGRAEGIGEYAYLPIGEANEIIVAALLKAKEEGE